MMQFCDFFTAKGLFSMKYGILIGGFLRGLRGNETKPMQKPEKSPGEVCPGHLHSWARP
jgi:hypothetical protein